MSVIGISLCHDQRVYAESRLLVRRSVTMKFLVAKGKDLSKEVSGFPLGREFAVSNLLVVCVTDTGEIVGACGIRSLLNVLVLFVKDNYRNRGVGTQLLRRAIEEAEMRRLEFITLSVTYDNMTALGLYRKFGFEEALYLRQSRKVLMMLSLVSTWRFACTFLRNIGPLLPNGLLTVVHSWVYSRTL